MFQLAQVTISTHQRQLCGSCGADKTRVFLRLVTKANDPVFRATNQHYILCEISKECTWHLCNARRGLWERSYEKGQKVKCLWVVQTVERWQRKSAKSGAFRWTFRYQPILKCWKTENWSGYGEMCVERAWTLAQRFVSPLWQRSTSQYALCQAVSGPKNRLLKCNTHPIPLIWLRMTSGCFLK
jgi:hypothetical protein